MKRDDEDEAFGSLLLCLDFSKNSCKDCCKASSDVFGDDGGCPVKTLCAKAKRNLYGGPSLGKPCDKLMALYCHAKRVILRITDSLTGMVVDGVGVGVLELLNKMGDKDGNACKPSTKDPQHAATSCVVLVASFRCCSCPRLLDFRKQGMTSLLINLVVIVK